jgi:oligoribonuclease
VLDFIRKYIGSATPLIAGNSVYMDLLFLKKYMPHLAAIFSHVIVDVSSISALCSRWFPKGKITPVFINVMLILAFSLVLCL